jgi:3-hydroxyacyl-[acyl-carrier-protein] dehydratase
MRFLFFDRILELEPNRHAVACKFLSVTEEYLEEHYRRRPIVPATLVLESLAQVAGWLHTVSHGFAIRTVLGLVEGVEVIQHVQPGATLRLEVWSEFSHKDGGTFRGEARLEDRLVCRVGRFLFASRPEADPAFALQRRRVFEYMSGGFRLGGGAEP